MRCGGLFLPAGGAPVARAGRPRFEISGFSGKSAMLVTKFGFFSLGKICPMGCQKFSQITFPEKNIFRITFNLAVFRARR